MLGKMFFYGTEDRAGLPDEHTAIPVVIATIEIGLRDQFGRFFDEPLDPEGRRTGRRNEALSLNISIFGGAKSERYRTSPTPSP
jgi:hypothetical protein